VNQTGNSATAQNDTRNFTTLFGGGEIKMSTTKKAVAPFGGLASFFSWLGAIGYVEKVSEAMPFGYRSPNAIPLEHTLTAFVSSVLAGASRFAHAGWLRHDKALHAMLGDRTLPGRGCDPAVFPPFHPNAH
jgi:hypothetical protein